MKITTAIVILFLGLVFGYAWSYNAFWNSRQTFCESMAGHGSKMSPKALGTVLRYCKGEEKGK